LAGSELRRAPQEPNRDQERDTSKRKEKRELDRLPKRKERGISQSRENRGSRNCQQVEDKGQEYSEFGRAFASAPIGKEGEEKNSPRKLSKFSQFAEGGGEFLENSE